MFRFFQPGKLIDSDLELVLTEQYPGDPSKQRVPAYKFSMKKVGRNKEIGKIDLRVSNNEHVVMYAGHIGYRVYPKYRSNRYAARACKLLFPLARVHGLNPLWITCNPDNFPSRRTCEILGAELVEIIDLPKYTDMYKSGERQKCRYRLEV